jgi:hypothetical protein
MDLPAGSRLTRISWLSTPDKYAGPKLFDSLDGARAHGPSPIVSAELEVRTPDGRTVDLSGGVPSADSIYRSSPRQDAGVLPALGAVVEEFVAAAHEVVFRNPDGGRFVLIVT